MGFPTKNDHFGVFWGYHHFRKHPYISVQRLALLTYIFHFRNKKPPPHPTMIFAGSFSVLDRGRVAAPHVHNGLDLTGTVAPHVLYIHPLELTGLKTQQWRFINLVALAVVFWRSLDALIWPKCNISPSCLSTATGLRTQPVAAIHRCETFSLDDFLCQMGQKTAVKTTFEWLSHYSPSSRDQKKSSVQGHVLKPVKRFGLDCCL